MMLTKNELKQYLKAVKRELHCSSAIKKGYIADLRCKLHDFIEEKKTATMHDIIKNFGTPTEIANSFKDINLDSFKSKVIKYRVLEGILAIVALGLIILIIILVMHLGGTSTITTT